MSLCPICNSPTLDSYFGKIREGKFGQDSLVSVQIKKCSHCHVEFLDPNYTKENISKDFYESVDYRNCVDNSSNIDDFYKNHDHEQIRVLDFLNLGDLRGKKIADIGCGAGSLLDFMKGVAASTYSVEPAEHFKQNNLKKGHQAYSYCSDLNKDLGEEQLDIVFSMSVIEHIEDVKPFLNDIYKSLKPGGTFWLSTPNNDDALKELLPEDYKKFYFRKVHFWYFNKNSITFLLNQVGFKNVQVHFFQRFGLSNFLNWLNFKKPSGNAQHEFINQSASESFRISLIESGK